MTTAHLLVIQHEDDCPPGRLVEAADPASLELRVVRAHHGDPVPEQLGEAAGLVVLGGGMSADDDAAGPWLPATRDLLREAVRTDLPTFGICLGEQIAALALGGSMSRAEAPELGLCPILPTEAGRCDPLIAALQTRDDGGAHPAAAEGTTNDATASPAADGPLVFHWHQDTVGALPPDSTLLASGPDGQVQAFRTGEALWAVQFHPEITPGIVTQWARTSSLTPQGIAPEEYGAMVADSPALQASWLRMLSAFVEQVVQRRTGAAASAVS